MIVPFILSGGSGTRLWPVSRESEPKPFLKLQDGLSLLQKTWLRVRGIPGAAESVIVTNRDYYFRTKDELAACGAKPGAADSFILEPVARNTGPAVVLAALYALERHGPDATVAVFASDHVINGEKAFVEAMQKAATLAARGRLVVFGAPPVRPETGYGYIESGPATDIADTFDVARFVEKPTAEVAQQFVDSGRFFWNTGIFVFRAGAVDGFMAEAAPDLVRAARACWEASQGAAGAKGPIELSLEKLRDCPAISFDFAVVEKVRDTAMVRAGFEWSDVGSWDAVSDMVHPDSAGNRIVGEAVLHDVRNTYIQSAGRVVAAVGVENLVIVDTSDALLVADRDRSQEVRRIVEQLRLQKHDSVKSHRTAVRPWGTFTVLEEGERFKIKRIVVKPQQGISLQYHHHRSEHWVVVSGAAKVTNGGTVSMLQANQSTFVAPGMHHRLENPGNVDLVVIEVQSGDYLGEDDIVRLEDRYGR